MALPTKDLDLYFLPESIFILVLVRIKKKSQVLRSGEYGG